MGLWIWKAIECFKWGLIDHPSRNREDNGAEGDVNCVGLLAQEISMEKNVSLWPTVYFSDISVKNIAGFDIVQRVCLRLR